ncbi:MAG: dienelactone hydrolase family protein [Mycobacterium sp.]
MATISIATPDGEITGILEKPTGTGPWPSIVVLHDISGSGRDLQRITSRIAADGYVAFAPDLYSRGGRARCITRVMTNLMARKGRAVDDILAARDYLIGLPDTTSSVGVVGFCMGGGFALLASTKGFGASAPFYGVLPRQSEQVLEDACPIVASFGKRDPMLIGGERKLRKTLDANGVEHDIKTYSGVGHSFANQLPMQPIMRITGFGYSPEVEADAWRRVYAFFEDHLSADRIPTSREAK